MKRFLGQAATGLGLATLIATAYVAGHIWGVFWFPLRGWGLVGAPVLVAAQTWLGAGMFIVAHDAMHGSLAPRRPRVNRAVGQLALGLYAAFPFDRLAVKHHAHHRHAGQRDDPDFHPDKPRAFWAWYARFFRHYFGVSQLALITAVGLVYMLVLHVSVVHILTFWALPGLLSSLQLFTFGTWLPHRHLASAAPGQTFVDHHRARSLDYGWWASLFACFHFGYHLEHHHAPNTPWWRLPEARRRARSDLARATDAEPRRAS